MTLSPKILLSLATASMAATAAAPAFAADPYDRAHGFGQRDPYARAAVDRCAAAAEDRARRYGPARVVRITNVDARRGGFLVSGELAVDNAGRWGDGWRRHHDRNGGRDHGWFKCRSGFGGGLEVSLNGF